MPKPPAPPRVEHDLTYPKPVKARAMPPQLARETSGTAPRTSLPESAALVGLRHLRAACVELPMYRGTDT